MVKRDRAIIIHDFASRAGSEDQFYTKSLSFFIADKKFKKLIKIALLYKKLSYDIIIFNWWIEESSLILKY